MAARARKFPDGNYLSLPPVTKGGVLLVNVRPMPCEKKGGGKKKRSDWLTIFRPARLFQALAVRNTGDLPS